VDVFGQPADLDRSDRLVGSGYRDSCEALGFDTRTAKRAPGRLRVYAFIPINKSRPEKAGLSLRTTTRRPNTRPAQPGQALGCLAAAHLSDSTTAPGRERRRLVPSGDPPGRYFRKEQ
jgi:hypothetical protein